MLDLEPDALKGVGADQAGVPADEAAVYVVGGDHRQLGARARERALERLRLQHAQQQVDIAADEAVTIMLDGPDMGRYPELDPGGRAEDMVVPADETAEPLGQRVDDALAGDTRRHHDQRAIAAVFAEATGPRDAGAVEGLLQHLVEFFVQIQADVIVAARAGESGDVDPEQGA